MADYHIALCFIQETEGQHLWSWSHREQGLHGFSWQTTDLGKAVRPQGHLPLPSEPLKVRKVVLLPVTPGDRAWEAAVRGRGVHTTQPRFHAGLGMEYPA